MSDRALTTTDGTATNGRIPVLKTYKLYIGGQFPRTESGRSYLVSAADGAPLANACRASRKDVRDAVRIAAGAAPGWAERTAMNRGQILYRVAELMEGRFDQFVGEVAAAEGVSAAKARELVGRAIDRWVWYAGWADKIAQVTGSANAVSGPYFDFSIPEPTGVVAIVAPQDSSLLGLVSVVAPAIVTGNTVVAVSSFDRPIPAVTLSEVLATSDLPGGVVNLLTGDAYEIAPWLASHMDVNAIDLTGVDNVVHARALEESAADNLKRVVRPEPVDWTADPGIDRMTAFLETKTVWHPIGT